jgi:hypothetical protein
MHKKYRTRCGYGFMRIYDLSDGLMVDWLTGWMAEWIDKWMDKFFTVFHTLEMCGIF